MKKKIDIVLITSTIACLLPILLMVGLYNQLPEQIAIHWNSSGEVDNYAPKAFAAFGLPLLFALLNLFTHAMMNNDPKKANASAAMKLLAKWMIPAISVIAMTFTAFIAMGVTIPIQVVIPAFVGLIIIICGNYLPKCKQNYTVGIKLPWTLSDGENWNKTHRLAGFLWVIGGLLMIVSAFTSLWQLSLAVLILLTAVPFVYSYVLYKTSTKNKTED